MIYFNNVSKIYGKDSVALDDITLTVNQGEFLSIVGHSGAGKTTLVKLILADDIPSSGSVHFESLNVHKLKNNELTKLRRRIGMVFS